MPGKSIEALKQANHLLLDSGIISENIGAKLTVGKVQKCPQNPLFGEDKPWEPRFDNLYANVIYDKEEKQYKCWYNPLIIDEQTTSIPIAERNPYRHPHYMNIKPNHREGALCYAYSDNGIDWKKPDLGIVKFDGNKDNNILMRQIHGPVVFKDTREIDSAKRYKLLHCGHPHMAVAFSADGLHWSEQIPIPEIEAHGTHPSAFWEPEQNKYVGFVRQHEDDLRVVTRTESPDFVHWTEDKLVLRSPNSRRQIHDLLVFPTSGIYVGLVAMMVHPQDSRHDVTQHVELAWSPDTITWHRIQEGTPLIENTPAGPQRYGEMPYDWGTIFPSAPVCFNDEIQIYYGASDWHFFTWRRGYLALATLRPDGWAGYEPTSVETEALITTNSLTLNSGMVGITADVWDEGFVRTQILDIEGNVQAHSVPIGKTGTNIQVQWTEHLDFDSMRSEQIRLRFTLRNAKLFSFQTH